MTDDELRIKENLSVGTGIVERSKIPLQRGPCPNSKTDSHMVRRFDKLIMLSLDEAQAHRPEQSRRKGCPYVNDS